MKAVIMTAIIALWGMVGQAQTVSITMTQQNLALVQETRLVSLKTGFNRIVLTNIPSMIDPSSVHFSFNKESIKYLEHNYGYDLENIQLMLIKSVGKNIRLLHPDLGTIQGKLISVNPGILVIETIDGELRVISDYTGLQFIIEKATSNQELIRVPSLFCSLQSNTSAQNSVEMTYLTGGLNWNSEYTAIIDEDEKNMSLSAKAVLSNNSGKSFQDFDLLLLAGEINRPKTMRDDRLSGSGVQRLSDIAMAAESDFSESENFEYHIYRLGGKITLLNQQQKILPLYPVQKTEISKLYNYHYQKDPSGISVIISAQNSVENGLGNPLPEGTVRIYKKDHGQLLIIGEDNISHTPKDEKLELKIGKAFDIIAERKIIDRIREGKNTEKTKISIDFRNRKNEDIDILVTEPVTRRFDYRILSSNIQVHKKDARQVEFIVPVKANQTNTLEYEILYSW